MLTGQAFMDLQWVLRKFDDLTPSELYNILRLRSEVFVVEQNCVFLDMDNKDQDCYHLMGSHDNELVAYVRIVPPGLAYEEMSIGRVVSSPRYRGSGAGRQLMIKAIATAYELFGKQPIRIGAQLYLKNFYNSLGFEPQGDIYIEDGIPHVIMLKH
jgi:ElaA protein